MIPQEEMIKAIETAIVAAEMGAVVPMTPEGLGLPEFEGDDEFLLRAFLMEKFEITSPVNPLSQTICVTQLVTEEDQTIYLLAKTSQTGQLVYLISPDSKLDI